MINDRKLRTRTSRLLMALPIAAVAFSLAACSAPAERPSAPEVAKGWQKIFEDAGTGDAYPEELVSCLAEALVDSKVSDEDLANIAAGKDVQTSTDAQALIQQVVTEAAPDCAAK